jgi:flagellar M-ring protein FliF
MPFDESGREVLPELPLWKDPDVTNFAKELGRYLLYGGLAAYLFFGVLRPYLRNLEARAESAGEMREIELAPQGALPSPVDTPPQIGGYEKKLLTARQLAKDDPKLVANVIRDWVSGNEQ